MRRGRDLAEVGGPGSGWGCRAGAGRQALARSQLCRNPRPGRPAESMRMLEWCGGRLPGAGPHEASSPLWTRDALTGEGSCGGKGQPGKGEEELKDSQDEDFLEGTLS